MLGNKLPFAGSAMIVAAVAVTFATLSSRTAAQDVYLDPTDSTFGEQEYSPYLDRGYPDRVYFGDTHLHTSYSADAGMFGVRLGPEEAYRFAMGQEVISNQGIRVRLQRPLDFLVVADHAENLGLAPMIAESNPDLLRVPWGRQIHDLTKSGKGGEAYNMWGRQVQLRDDPLKDQRGIAQSMWERLTTAAARIRASVLALMRPGLLSARDTVDGLTPVACAMS